ncbi:MAG: DNA ligase D [Flavobacterium sp.]|nr:DNA ligase D [Flavobacterium sp.]
MALEKYNTKRDFNKTKEPKGVKKPSKGDLRFVVQKHAASRLHYDFRLEIDGVLVSWAVPKGPSADPADKRLAMQTEDHPMDYIDFEGTIPKGQYGGGTVMVWDIGTYHAEGNDDSKKDNSLMKKQLADGSIKVTLNGEKLKGSWHLVPMKSKDDSKPWLMMKAKDEHAATDKEYDGLSVLTKRDLDEIAKGNEVWQSNRNADEPKNNSTSTTADFTPEDLANAVKISEFPSWKPMLATLADEPFDNADWIFETKFDGYRALAEIKNGKAKLISRNSNTFTKYPEIVAELEDISSDVVIDGEIVVEDGKGKSWFQWLQHRGEKPKRGQLKFYVFDILYFNGFDLRKLDLLLRKKILRAVLPELESVLYSEHIVGDGLKAFAAAEKSGGEGIIAKKASSKYSTNKRSKEWLKIKTEKQQEMVIGGFTEPQGGRKGLGAILCGFYDGKELRYSGKVGSGFSDAILKELRTKLDKIERKSSPFVDPPKESNVHWVSPKLVAQIKFSELTETNAMRHPVYLGLRPDKKAGEVTLELPEVEADQVEGSTTEPNGTSENANSDKTGSKKATAKKLKSATKFAKQPPEKLSASQVKELTDQVAFTNLNKVFYPKDKITKGDVISYYNSIADYILPYLIDRPQSLRRTPNGVKDQGFFQKNVGGMVPKWIKTRKIRSESKEEPIEYLLCQDKDTLLFLANWGCIELNPWSSRVGSLNNPDYIIFDLDPKDAPLENIIKTARKVKEVLDKLNVPGYIKTSGGNGLHVFIPVKPKYTYEQTRNFSHLVSQMVNRDLPDITSLERMPSKRKGMVYLDFLQNGKGKTMASIYSLRPREGAGVSTPLEWDEIDENFDLKNYNIFTILPRLKEKGDLWKGIFDNAIDLKQVLANL